MQYIYPIPANPGVIGVLGSELSRAAGIQHLYIVLNGPNIVNKQLTTAQISGNKYQISPAWKTTFTGRRGQRRGESSRKGSDTSARTISCVLVFRIFLIAYSAILL